MQWVLGALSQEVKLLGSESDQSSLQMCSYTSTLFTVVFQRNTLPPFSYADSMLLQHNDIHKLPLQPRQPE